METSRTSMKRIVIFFVFLSVTFVLLSLRSRSSGSEDLDLKSTELLEASLEQEKSVLSRSCEGLRNVNQAIHTGSFTFLGGSLETLEELVTSGQSLSCVADRTTSLIIDKLRRLELTDIYSNCLGQDDCSPLLPALKDIENHFEHRMSNIEELKTTVKLIRDLFPRDSETHQQFNEASSMLNNFYLCLDFVFSEIPNVYKILISSNRSDSQSSSGKILSTIVLMAFRLLMIIGLFVAAPKNIWKFHLFIIKTVIIFLILVLCVGFYNYGSLLLRSFLFSNLKYQLYGSTLEVLSHGHFTKNIWTVEKFKSANIQMKMIELPDIVQIDGNKLELQEFLLTPEKMELLENLKTNLALLSEMETEEYKDLVLEVRVVLEKHLPVFSSAVRTMLQCQSLYNYTADQMGDQDFAQQVIGTLPALTRLEEDLSRHKNRLQVFLKKVTKLEREVAALEEQSVSQVKGVGGLVGLVGVLTAPHLSRQSLGCLATLGVTATLSAHTSAYHRHSLLHTVRHSYRLFKVASKKMIDIVDQLEILNLIHSVTALALNSDDFYQEETRIMLRESEHKVKLALRTAKDLSEIK